MVANGDWLAVVAQPLCKLGSVMQVSRGNFVGQSIFPFHMPNPEKLNKKNKIQFLLTFEKYFKIPEVRMVSSRILILHLRKSEGKASL